jgi:hypothetical protein
MKVEVDLFADDLGFAAKRRRGAGGLWWPPLNEVWSWNLRDRSRADVPVDVRRVQHLGPGEGGKRKVDS